MLVLKLEQNLFQELGRLPSVNERTEGDSAFRTMDVDFYEGISNVTVEKRKYPFFYSINRECIDINKQHRLFNI